MYNVFTKSFFWMQAVALVIMVIINKIKSKEVKKLFLTVFCERDHATKHCIYLSREFGCNL